MPRTRSYRRRYRRKQRVSYPVKKYVKQQINRNIETKVFQSYVAAEPMTQSWDRFCLNNITQGVEAGENIGNQLDIKRITGNMMATLGDATNIYRVLIFQWFQPATLQSTADSTWPPTEQVLDHINDSSGDQANWASTPAYQNRKNYKILLDWKSWMNNTFPYRMKKVSIKAHRIRPIQFTDDSTGTRTQLAIGGIFMHTWSDSSAATHPALTWDFRIRYKDG